MNFFNLPNVSDIFMILGISFKIFEYESDLRKTSIFGFGITTCNLESFTDVRLRAYLCFVYFGK